MIALTVNVEISDQMGKDKAFFIGVFSDSSEMEQVKALVERRFYDRRTWWKEYHVALNMAIIPDRSELYR